MGGVPPERIMPAAPAAPPAAMAPPAAPAAVFEPVAEPRAPAPAFEPRVESRAVPPAPAAPPPQPDLDTVLRESGLVMIETAHDKVRETEPVAAEQLPRPRRERRPPPPGANEPLEQVETRAANGPADPGRS
jgi:hypothetical protein